ncbi:caspase domain-containing protein [Annulohypoxylon truncatum]|uniref:caspase domain-containing protein n=1 Tax=Annulohypoxylon truncatum TaxID=327061 RepID=UPI0020075B6A|nr:caspase domain-containing protein [Annulohypoxylon truncatum]KAI1214272.1 caspase domain-containing protein [Annulohypoxylon truncatum]
MAELNPIPTHFALLIGVNSDSKQPLKGCVRDVREIARSLDRYLDSVHIQLFTAEDESAHTTSSGDIGIPEILATYSNVKAGLEKMSSLAKCGTHVYIHYSGHGVRREAASKDYSSRMTGDLALNVLEDSGGNCTQPFLGLDLAHIMNTMVSNDVTVTLVLDCCFSGSVLRKQRASDQLSLRYREHDPEAFDLPSSSSTGDGMEIEDFKRPYDEDYRDASMLDNWLINPDGYTVLTACGPHEIAEELNFPGQSYKHGALSYFILRAIEKLGGLGGKHAHIYPYLSSMFRQLHPKQNPMWYGNADLCFFGTEALNPTLTGTPFAAIWKKDQLQLQGGQAHGVCEGDQFAIYTIAAGRPLVTGTATHVRPLTSDVEVSHPERIRGEKGLIAKALTRLSLRKYPIQLNLNPSCLEDWQLIVARRENLVFEDKAHPFAFHISLDEGTKTYRIRDNSGREKGYSTEHTREETMMTDPSRVLDIAERLAKYKMVKDLANDVADIPLEGQYRVVVRDSAGTTFQAGSIVDAQERDILHLVVTNRGTAALYVHVLNLTPLGQVQSILKASYAVVPPEDREEGLTGEWTHKVRTKVPPALVGKGVSVYEDIVKILITNQPTSFASLEMQELYDSHDRGAVEPGDRGQGPRLETEDWISLNFNIRTHSNGHI